ncbi:phenazine biosynthesis protein PhzF family [Melghirimyces thermohalophilus]|uniref:Phenazine biosynthesis protein PhzF family n=1 Tax=Melghirimyces thermohalophilus TaxID=1236220 RepID=A0A1G6R335_9BACL|nr:phenazine biosynthesis protein PhzF family [Melghirimyces thermohalophilus]
MQLVAREINLSETAFLHRENDAFRLRWFTPSEEEKLCGHATLASAHVLWEQGILRPEETARFQTKSGLLTARRHGAWIQLDFPAESVKPTEIPVAFQQAFGDRIRFLGVNRMDHLLELESEEEVRCWDPAHPALSTLPIRRGLIVTAPSAEAGCDIVSRFPTTASRKIR